jgi:hypothetical protein
VKRGELAIALLVGALAIFVGRSVALAPHPGAQRRSRRPAEPDTVVARHAPVSPVDAATQNDVRVASSNMAPQRDTADVRQRLASSTDSYMGEMLADQKRALQRWPDRRTEALRVWVQTLPSVHDYNDQYAQMARDAFSDWREGFPMPIDFVLDSSSADVRVVWLDRFPPEDGRRVGVTARSVDQFGWIVSAQIAIAIHDSSGAAIPPVNLAGVARHEAGHALGLGHSRDARTIMFPVQMMTDVQPPDRATLRLLYSLPPGPVP